MYGGGMGSLNVGAMVGNMSLIKWTKRGNQGAQWKEAQVEISQVENPFKVHYYRNETVDYSI